MFPRFHLWLHVVVVVVDVVAFRGFSVRLIRFRVICVIVVAVVKRQHSQLM